MAANVHTAGPHYEKGPLIPALTLRHLTLSSSDVLQPLKNTTLTLKGCNREFIPESATLAQELSSQFPQIPSHNMVAVSLRFIVAKQKKIINQDTF